MLTFDDITEAAERIRGVVHRTPVLTSRTLDELTGRQVFLKAENLQRTGAFKMRGAYNAVARLAERQPDATIVTYSSGNHGQAIAHSAQLLGLDACVVMPHDAPEVKAEAVTAYGAEIVRYDRYTESRDGVAATVAADRGATVIPPFDHLDVMAGQGTCGLELIEEVGDLDVVAVCLGGGGLLSGVAIATRHLSPDTSVVGVEPAAGDDGKRSLAAGRRVTIEQPVTIADGQATTSLGELTFEVISAKVDAIETVTDDEIVDAMRFCFDRLRIVVEPSGASSLAAVMAGRVGRPGDRVGVTLSGGNVDRASFAELLTR